MAYNLSNLLQDLYANIGDLSTSIATGGSTTTVVDTKLAEKYEEDDILNNGTIFITETTDNAAPEGEYALITAWDDSTGTFTFAALTTTTASGDVFSFTTAQWPLYTMIEAINRALRTLGTISLVDTTTLDSAANQTEYAAAVAWKNRPPTRIDIQTNTNDANDNRWFTIRNWDFVPAAAGSTGLIIFRDQPPATRDLRIWYTDQHPRVSAYSDVISETIPPQLILAYATEEAMKWRVTSTGGGDRFLIQRWNDAKVELERAKQMYHVWMPRKMGKIMTVRNAKYWDEGGPDRVKLY